MFSLSTSMVPTECLFFTFHFLDFDVWLTQNVPTDTGSQRDKICLAALARRGHEREGELGLQYSSVSGLAGTARPRLSSTFDLLIVNHYHFLFGNDPALAM